MKTIFIIIFILVYLYAVIVLASSCQTGMGAILTVAFGVILAVPVFFLVYAYVWVVGIFLIGGLFLLGSND